MNDAELVKKRKSTVIAALRRASRFWPAKAEAYKLAKVSPGKFKCNSCAGIYPQKETNCDHIIPIISVDKGFTSWDDFVNNLFCNIDNLQILCQACHSLKSLIEKERRAKYRAIRKKATKKK